MSPKKILLTTREMAQFASQGFLRFDELIPRDLCDQLFKDIDNGEISEREPAGAPFNEVWRDKPIREVFDHPRVSGMIESLVGPNPIYDHHHPHVTKRGGAHQFIHADAEYDPRVGPFDIQLSFFPQDVTPDMGGTLFVPGSHFHRVHESQVGIYQNIVGMQQFSGKAGTVLVWHTNLWHSGRRNDSDNTRYMFKLRLNPAVKQQLLWDTDDLHDSDSLSPLIDSQPWHGQQQRVFHMNVARFWRYLTNDPSFDLGFYWSRIENKPQEVFQDTQT